MSEQTTNPETTNPFGGTRDLIEPWARVMGCWYAETEKARLAAVESLARMLDHGQRLAREGLETTARVGAVVHKEIREQMEKTIEIVGARGT